MAYIICRTGLKGRKSNCFFTFSALQNWIWKSTFGPLKNYLFNNKIPHHDSRIFEIIISVFYLSPYLSSTLHRCSFYFTSSSSFLLSWSSSMLFWFVMRCKLKTCTNNTSLIIVWPFQNIKTFLAAVLCLWIYLYMVVKRDDAILNVNVGFLPIKFYRIGNKW